MKFAAQQGPGLPVQSECFGFKQEVFVVDAQSVDLYFAEQGAAGIFDLNRSIARPHEFLPCPLQPLRAVQPEGRDAKYAGDHSKACDDDTDGEFLARHVQNLAPSVKWKRTLPFSCGFATSRFSAPAGVIMRMPAP